MMEGPGFIHGPKVDGHEGLRIIILFGLWRAWVEYLWSWCGWDRCLGASRWDPMDSLRALQGCGKGVFVVIAWQLGAAAWQAEVALGSLSRIHPLCLTLMGICLHLTWCGVLIFPLACASLQILFFCHDFLSCPLSCPPAGLAVSVWPGHMSCPLFWCQKTPQHKKSRPILAVSFNRIYLPSPCNTLPALQSNPSLTYYYRVHLTDLMESVSPELAPTNALSGRVAVGSKMGIHFENRWGCQ